MVFVLLRCKTAAELQLILSCVFPEVLLWIVTFQRPKVLVGRTGNMPFAHLVFLKNFKEILNLTYMILHPFVFGNGDH